MSFLEVCLPVLAALAASGRRSELIERAQVLIATFFGFTVFGERVSLLSACASLLPAAIRRMRNSSVRQLCATALPQVPAASFC